MTCQRVIKRPKRFATDEEWLAEKRLKAVEYRAAQPKSGRNRGAQPKYSDRSIEAARRRSVLACRRWRESPVRVAQRWYREQFRVGLWDVVLSEGIAAHDDWLESLDDDAEV
jgi:hypothetical protein